MRNLHVEVRIGRCVEGIGRRLHELKLNFFFISTSEQCLSSSMSTRKERTELCKDQIVSDQFNFLYDRVTVEDDKEEEIDIICMGSRKAFDFIQHDILINKLGRSGPDHAAVGRKPPLTERLYGKWELYVLLDSALPPPGHSVWRSTILDRMPPRILVKTRR